MHFAPRGSREKRSRILPPVRLDEEEFKIVEWLVEQLSAQDERKYTVTDIVRLGLGKLYEAQTAAVEPPRPAGTRGRSKLVKGDLNAAE